MKAVLIVCDGMGDRPVHGETPLSAAKTPNLNELATGGVNGIMDIISPGIVPGSDTAHLAILGYDPYEHYAGRGVFEALGAGLELREGDVAFRANFATVDERLVIKDRRAGRKGDKRLEAAIDGMEIDGVRVILRNTVGHRCAVVLRPLEEGIKLSKDVSDCDPHADAAKVLECKPLSDDTAARRTAVIVNELLRRSHEILKEHPANKEREERGEPPANILLLRGAGEFFRVERFEERWGFRAACVAGASLYKGVARFIGMNVLHVENATGDQNTDLKAKARAALKALKDYDFVFIHVKATDNFGHDGDFEGKRRMLERIDEELVAEIRRGAEGDILIAVTADHSTPVSVKRHSGDPVPLLIHGEGVRYDDVSRFDELSAARGGLCRLRGLDLMSMLADLMGFSKMYGT
ncbi:MAG: 2,3-bisphosphoglycerate-independent phosphoglycerate mutase [Candidatus Alkanophagales archaeon]|nr:MAG: 2,3-bisphosphoglycerate-independent phosphoglycerate mutase [Candidatus Alkanophagales archaeon]